MKELKCLLRNTLLILLTATLGEGRTTYLGVIKGTNIKPHEMKFSILSLFSLIFVTFFMIFNGTRS